MQLPEHPEAQGLHRAIVEQAQDAIIFIDRDGLIQLWNRGAEIIFGYAASEVMGRDIDIIIPEKLRAGHAQGFRRAIQAGVTRHDGRVMTTRATHKFGSRLYVEMSFGLLKDADGTVRGAFAIGRDGTARHQAEVARRVQAEGQVA